MVKPTHRGPDLLDLLAEADAPPVPEDPAVDVCPHGTLERMYTGGAEFQMTGKWAGWWVHAPATCRLPMSEESMGRELILSRSARKRSGAGHRQSA